MKTYRHGSTRCGWKTKQTPLEEGMVLYVSSPIPPCTAELFFGITKELLEKKGCRTKIMGEPDVDLRKCRRNLLMPYVEKLAEEIREMEPGVTTVLNGNPGEIMLMALQEHPKLAEHINRMIFFNCSLHTGRDKEMVRSYESVMRALREIEGAFMGDLMLEIVANRFLDSKSGFSLENAEKELRKCGYPEPKAAEEIRRDIVRRIMEAGPRLMRRANEDWFELMKNIDYVRLYELYGDRMYCFCTSLKARQLKAEHLTKVFQMEGVEHHIVTLDRPATTANIILDVLRGRYDSI